MDWYYPLFRFLPCRWPPDGRSGVLVVHLLCRATPATLRNGTSASTSSLRSTVTCPYSTHNSALIRCFSRHEYLTTRLSASSTFEVIWEIWDLIFLKLIQQCYQVLTLPTLHYEIPGYIFMEMVLFEWQFKIFICMTFIQPFTLSFHDITYDWLKVLKSLTLKYKML